MKLISLEEAAGKLGMSPDELKELRTRGDLYGYRDGTSWKFKEEDVERLAAERAESGGGKKATSDSDELLDLSLDDDPSGEMVLVSDVELGESDPGTSSTVIGRPGTQNPEESDIRLTTAEDRQAKGSSKSDVQLATHEPAKPGSDVKLVSVVDAGAGAGTTEMGPGSDFSLGDDALELSLDGDLSLDDDVLGVEEDARGIVTREMAPAPDGSSLELAAEDDALVIGSKGSGSDITLGSGDSGISLADPSDSGLSLEGPLELSGANEEPLELGEEPVFSLADDSDSQEVSAIAGDDEFLLTPMETAGEEVESDDSGSQVIALESDTDFVSSGELAAAAAAPMLEEEPLGAGALGLGSPALAGAGAAATMAPLAAREPAYTIWNVLSLGMCAVFLGLAGMMSVELLRTNMGPWDSPYRFNSAIMDLILSIVP